ncbi:MAG: hypothetical protein FWE55_00130 [Synergistaceae bacterium]|nr:hypothetical protein [Synergistaceae bacterium]
MLSTGSIRKKGMFGILRLRKRSGFSLIIVLIVSLIGFAIVAVALQATMMSSGSGRAVSAGNTKYNFLQDAVEEGKAALKKAMDNDNPPPRYADYDTEPSLTDVDDLLIEHSFNAALGNGVVLHRNFNRNQLGRLGIAGRNSGSLTVKVFDMQYPADSVAPGIDISLFPPSMFLYGSGEGSYDPGTVPPTTSPGAIGSGAATNAGVYLIRASLEVAIGSETEKTLLDTAVIQSNNTP